MLSWALLQLTSLLFASAGQGTPVQKYPSGRNHDYEAALQFLSENDALASTMDNKNNIASWNYETNLTKENKMIMLQSRAKEAKFTKKTWQNATSFAWKEFKGKNDGNKAYRWFKKLAKLGVAALPEDKLHRLNSLVADMQDVYSKAKVCSKNSPPGKPCDLSLEPELTEILTSSRDANELKHIWAEWRKVSGRKVKEEFLEYVQLSNEAAKLNGFHDAGAMWRDNYESKTFEDDLAELWRVIQPLYQQLHAFVRRRLIQQYPDVGIRPDGPIPAHLLGNMWAQTWGNIFDIVKPFEDAEDVDVSDRMRQRHMSALDMFKMSEEFFTSLGLKPMTREFWNRSIIEKPKDRDMVCHASAWDFADGKDFRIKMCTRINMEHLIVIHHEMGHIQYYMQYAHQPDVFRAGANQGFHEAVGDTLALSVSTSKHLKKIGLLDDKDDDEEMEINGLMKMALTKLPFLPYGYLIDSWRWKVFSGEFKQDQLNSKWWEQRLEYQGLCPPVRRTDEDLDAATKYHVVADVPYIRYFVSHIVQFQFHKALCEEAGHTGPLHQCDIYQNKKAGKLLSRTLSLGSSVHWSEAMNVITKGKTKKMDAQPLVEYFQPLMKFLQKENEGEMLGWKSIDPMMCPHNHHIKQF